MSRKSKPWTIAELALLGTDSDVTVAKRLGCSVGTVRAKRYKRGIPPHVNYRRTRQWGTTEVVLFEKYADAAIAKLTRRPLEAVKAKRAELHRNKRPGRRPATK